MNRKQAMIVVSRLKAKRDSGFFGEDRKRMPSISSIHKMLDFFGVEHSFNDSVNVVTYRTAGRMYVNERHDGKQGKELRIKDNDKLLLDMDTSSSYYSINARQYARRLLEILEGRKLLEVGA